MSTGNTTHTIVLLIKFGSEVDMRDLLERGTIYMNTIEFFRRIEDGQLRGDNYEGVTKIWNLPAGQFQIPEIDFKGNYISMHLSESYTKILGNIYSLYCISSHGFEGPSDVKLDSRVSQFGTHGVIIKNLPAFFSRIETSAKLLGYSLKHDFVEYYKKMGVNKEISIFEKPDDFSYQKEFRFFIHQNNQLPIKFQIGCLKDIAEMVTIDVLMNLTLKSNA